MDKEKKDIILYNVRQFLNENENLKDMNIHSLIVDKNNSKNGIAIASNEEYIVAIDIENYECEYSQEWDYDIDMNIFRHLENEMNIEFITSQWHCLIWEKIESYEFIDDIFYKEGMQKYLEYCRDEKITQEFLQEECDTDLTDVMKYSNDYISNNNGVIEMSKGKYKKESEINYIAFCLGYDLLNDKLSESEKDECDNVYDFCNYLAKKFIETDYYKNALRSTYDSLREWLEDNKEIIQSEYLYYFNFDNKHILETGNRGETKVALVERTTDYGKDYMIAFNYAIDNKKLEGSYIYYYDNDLKKAKEDFEKVKAGGNLADTFKLQTSVNDEVRETVENKKEFVEQVMKKQKKSKEKER